MMLELRNALCLPDQTGVAADKQRQTEFQKIPIDGSVPVYVNKDELLKLDKIPSQHRLGGRFQRWFTYIVSGLLAVSVAAGVAFMITRRTRDMQPTTGSVHAVSVPTGADVTFDGTLLSDRTPVTIAGSMPR